MYCKRESSFYERRNPVSHYCWSSANVSVAQSPEQSCWCLSQSLSWQYSSQYKVVLHWVQMNILGLSLPQCLHCKPSPLSSSNSSDSSCAECFLLTPFRCWSLFPSISVFTFCSAFTLKHKNGHWTNRPFPSSPQPPFQSEAKCEISFHSYSNCN